MMRVYVYQAALLCEKCGEAMRNELDGGPDARNEDSSYYPQGPYGQGGGEADSPQHCDHCSVFLENPLTEDGAQYVSEKAGAFTIGGGVVEDGDESWEDVARKADAKSPAVAQWIRFYLAPGQ